MSMGDFPPFRPRPPWLSGDLQTVRNFVCGPVLDLAAHPSKRLALPMRDGSGDRLLGDLSEPDMPPPSSPLVVLIHGLGGCAESAYMLATARHFLDLGYRVLRLNLRGTVPTRAICRGHYHAGRSQDFHDAIAALPAPLVRDGVFAIGFSLGGNMLLKYLAEQGADGPVRAAATVSAPINLEASSRRIGMPRNRVYHDWLLRHMKKEALGPGSPLEAELCAAIRRARTIYEYDECFVAPRHGFASAQDYYQRCSGVRFMPEIKVPTLLIHALDDPWIPGESYTAFAWRDHPDLVPLLPRWGGHVGFHGADSRIPWHDRCTALFFSRWRDGGRPRAKAAPKAENRVLREAISR